MRSRRSRHLARGKTAAQARPPAAQPWPPAGRPRLRMAGAAAGAVSVLMLAACSTGTAATATTTSAGVTDVQLWESHSGATNPVAQAEAAIVAQFNKSQQHVKVSILETKASSKALAAAQAGHPPLLAEISHYDGQFRNSGAIIPLNSFMTGAGGFTSAQLAAFYPGVLVNGRIPQAIRNGKAAPGQQYRLPADVKVSELFYNTALFRQAGISGCPSTWDQLGSDLTRLKRLGVTPMGYKDSSAHIDPPFIANGGQLYKPGSGGRATMYDSPAGVTTFSQFRSWYAHGLFIFSHGANMRAALANKKLAIEDGTSAGWVKVLQAAKAGGVQVGACPYPAGTSGHPGNLIQGLGFVVFAHHSRAQQQAAFQFVRFWNSPKEQAYWAVHSGFTPTTSAAVPLISSSFLSSPAGAGLKVSLQEIASPYSQPRGQQDNFAEVDSALDAAFFSAVTGKQPVSQALSQLDASDAKYLSSQSKI